MHCRSRISFGLSTDQPWLLPSFIHAQQTQTLCFSSIREEEKEEEETKKVILTVKDKKMKKNVSLSTLNSSVNTEIHGRKRRRSVKVIGLGTRASNALQFCRESSLLPSAELWISTGDVDNQSFCLLNKDNRNMLDDQQCKEAPSVIICVIGVGANSCTEEALGILQANRVQGSLSVMIIIQPFKFEGLRRKKELQVLAGILFKHTDLCLVFEHDALVSREKVKLTDALKIADNTVLYAIKAISDLCLGDQVKVFDAPLEGLRDITSAEILSMLFQAGKAGVGFGSSYSVKSAVQRAAFESPFLQGLVPGVKGLVVCTISCAEEKDKKDLQSALHALRCIIGPRAKLVCTSTIEPTLKQGVVLVTILFTRIENGGIQDILTLPLDAHSPFTSSLGGNMVGYPSSMNGRELRKSTEVLKESADGRSSAILKEPAKSNSLSDDAPTLPTGSSKSELSNGYNYGDIVYNNATKAEDDSKSSLGESVVDDSNSEEYIERLSTPDMISIGPDPHRVLSMDSPIELDKTFLCELPQDGNRSNAVLTQELSSGLVISEDDEAEMIDKTVPSPNRIVPKLDNDENGMWNFFTLPTILDQRKKMVMGGRQPFSVWEPGPNSADAEAWAQTRQKLGNLGDSDRNTSFQAPVGIRSTNEYKGESLMGKDQGKQWGLANQAIFDFAAPLISRVITSGLEAVIDIYNAASANAFKKDESEESKQVSSLLSQRAASMLESERSSVKLPPMVEMKYKNGIYKGRCKEGLPEGKGRLGYADGSFYDGMWKQGKRVGIGSFYYANGDVFQGNWRDDQMHGKGWFYFRTGERLYADFWKGKANGEGRYYSAKGDVFFGHFRDGWRHGKSISIEGGVRWCEIWDNGVLASRSVMEDLGQN